MQKINKKIDEFFGRYKSIEYKAKETVIHMSDEPAGVFYVKKGFVKMNTILSNGSELTLNIFKPGSFFPMTWAVANAPNNYLFQTMSSASLYKAPRKEMVEFLVKNPDILYDLTRRLLSGIDGLLTNISHLVAGTAANRVASAILLCSRRFGEKVNENQIAINIHLTHQDIADLAGLTRETTSITMSMLKKRKIVTQVRGRIIINNQKELHNLSQIEQVSASAINTL